MSKTKPLLLYGILVTISVILFVCVYANQVMVKGCLWWECAPARSFDVTDLGLTSDLFPDNAKYQPIEISYSDNSIPIIKSGVQIVKWDHGNVRYSVSIYPIFKNPPMLIIV